MELKNKTIKLFLKTPKGFRYSGAVIEESEGFIVIQNDHTGKTNYISKDNILSMEVD